MLERIAKRRPFLILAFLSTAISALWFAVNLPYDDGGWGTFLLIAAYSVGAVQVLVSHALHALNGDWLPWHGVFALALTLALYLIADQAPLGLGNRDRSGSAQGSVDGEASEP